MNPIIAAAYLLLGQPGATQPVLVANLPTIDCPAPTDDMRPVKPNHATVRWHNHYQGRHHHPRPRPHHHEHFEDQA